MMITEKVCAMNILLADDGSEHSQAAVTMLGDLPLSETSQIMALRVFTPASTGEVWGLEDALKLTRAALEKQGKNVESHLALGHPAEEIVKTAQQRNSDLIVMGAKGLRATLGILLGGVAQQVVEHADRPVLVIRAPYTGIKRVLLAIDGSPQSQDMISCISKFPLPDGVEIHILHVAPPLVSAESAANYWIVGADTPTYFSLSEIQEKLEKQTQQEELMGQKILANATEILLHDAGIESKSSLLRGDAATEIIQYVKDNQIDLVVSGGRGLSRIRSWLLGSVSRKLLHYAPCSVMVVKGKPD
ncbi:MAG: hypothetical protein B6I38_00045 [Anaerolineaceae bacterium 4572_5.1]|nr:MAG: hypothetical protein B6I38_00045 [Anaerolineaceae bacterium 4572_5.1]